MLLCFKVGKQANAVTHRLDLVKSENNAFCSGRFRYTALTSLNAGSTSSIILDAIPRAPKPTTTPGNTNGLSNRLYSGKLTCRLPCKSQFIETDVAKVPVFTPIRALR